MIPRTPLRPHAHARPVSRLRRVADTFSGGCRGVSPSNGRDVSSTFRHELPEVGKNSVGETECHGELEFFLQRIEDGPDAVVGGFGNPPFETRPKETGHDRVIASVQNLARIFSEPVKRSKMRDLGEGRNIAVKVRKRFSHLVELIEIISIPRQGWCPAMCGDDVDPALERQAKRFNTLKVPAMGRQRELASGMRQERKFQLSHPLPERFVEWPVAINGLHARQELQESGACFHATL